MDTASRTIEEIKVAATEILRHAVPGLLRFATAGALNLDQLSEKEIGQLLASYASDRFAHHKAAQQSMEKFKGVLRDMAKRLSQPNDDRPLIVMIDELDRCRPTYAVELLEVAKHLFAVHGVIFVLAVNRSELAHSIKALYGNQFNAERYLRRFFDVDFRLPDPERRAFVDAMLDSMQIDTHLRRTQDREARQDEQTVRKLLSRFFGASDIGLREIAQSIHRLGLVFASLRANQKWFFTTMVVAVILRTLDSNLYGRFARGEASDLEVVESVYERVGGHRSPVGFLYSVQRIELLSKGLVDETSSATSRS